MFRQGVGIDDRMTSNGVRAVVTALATNNATWAVLVPVILIVVSATAKRLIRNSNKWEVGDWFTGVELTLAAISSMVMHSVSLCRKLLPADTSVAQQAGLEQSVVPLDLGDIGTQLCTAGFCAFVAGVCVLILMLAHRELDRSTDTGSTRRWKVAILLGINWVVGAGLLVGYELFIKAPNG